MSRLWPERLAVGLAPECLSGISLSGGWRQRLVDRHALPLTGQRGGEWDKGLAGLESLLADPMWRNRDITVILSAHYVRHAVIPAAPGLAEAERLALAKVVFSGIFGELAADWELRISPSAGGAPTLASGVPRGLINALRLICADAGTLHSIQPSLMPVFNHVRRQIGSAACHMAVVEPGRVTLVSVENQQWRHVDSRAGDGNILPQLLLEEGELHERNPGGILLLCDLTEKASLPESTFWSCRQIKPPVLAGFDDIPNLAVWGVA